MTIYFRPDRIEYSYPTTAQESFSKDDSQMYNVTLSVKKVTEEKTGNLITYSLDEVNHEFLHKGNFIGLSARGDYFLEITNKDSVRQKEILKFNFEEWISTFKGCKNDLFTNEISIGNYRIQCSYGYNKFLEVCGMSKFYEFTVQPTGVVAEKIKKMKHDAFFSASKGKLDDKQKKNAAKNQNQIIQQEQRSKVQQSSKAQQKTASKDNKEQFDQVSNFKMVNPIPKNLFNAHPPEKPSESQEKKEVKFYKGPCKTSNFFSCLDPKMNISKEYHFIQEPYI